MREKIYQSLPDAILVFFVTIAGYAAAFSYVAGRYAFFGIDLTFIQISPYWIAFGAFISLAIMFVIDVIYTQRSSLIFKIERSDYKRRLIRDCIVAFLLVPLLLFILTRFIAPNGDIWLQVGIIFGPTAFYVVIALLTITLNWFGTKDGRKAIRLYYENVDAREKTSSRNSDPVRLSIIADQLPFILLAAVLCTCCYFFGYTLVISPPDNLDSTKVDTNLYGVFTFVERPNGMDDILIGQYQDKIIVKGYNSTNHKLENGYSLLTDVNLHFYSKRVIVKK